MLDVISKYYYIFNPIKCLIHLFHFKSILATENTFMISSSSCWYLLYTTTLIHIFIKYAKGLLLCIFEMWKHAGEKKLVPKYTLLIREVKISTQVYLITKPKDISVVYTVQ